MQLGSTNSNVTVSGNMISNTSTDGVVARGNTNLTLSDNTFTMIGDDAFDFGATSYSSLLPGSNGNVTTDAPGGQICRGVAGIFTGTLQVTDQNGILQTFTNGC